MNFEEVEYFLANIKSVLSCKIITDSNNNITEIHVLSDSSRHSKQIVRDIRTALLSHFNLDIDYKIISVAQVNKNISINSDFRLLYVGHTNETYGEKIKIIAKFTWDEKEFVGEAEGLRSEKNTLMVAALATLNAIKKAIELECFIVDDIQTARISGQDVLLSSITYYDRGREILLIGSSIIHNNKIDSTIKATLNAINRKICLFIKE
ncbi:hypothetical protein HZF24_16410 [Sedimentibacter hydroxybenzoicus DSM 7310]|uniref:Uncharacterized protein n=1 Tax=Sedimentibacter hydroxybenzoicus DSM 7310 TaxID=1123245 RepID=A0A974BML9_SEDHY|nr:hypothetical protein [Sedimentibacter hydroxybenzoicus]NYB75733.1 hypothetical protein [Sedimentibacter hydroxybenzoicus DSM 7310]